MLTVVTAKAYPIKSDIMSIRDRASRPGVIVCNTSDTSETSIPDSTAKTAARLLDTALTERRAKYRDKPRSADSKK